MVVILISLVCVVPQDMSALAKKMIGRPCYVGWPYLVEAKVHSLANKEKLYCMVRHLNKKKLCCMIRHLIGNDLGSDSQLSFTEVSANIPPVALVRKWLVENTAQWMWLAFIQFLHSTSPFLPIPLSFLWPWICYCHTEFFRQESTFACVSHSYYSGGGGGGSLSLPLVFIYVFRLQLPSQDKVGGKTSVQAVDLGGAEVKKYMEESTIVTRRCVS